MQMEIGKYKPVHGKDGKFMSRLFTRFINWLKVALWRSAIVCAFGWAIFAGYMLRELDNSTIVAYAATTPITALMPIEMKGKTIDQLENEVIDQLAKGENEGGVPCYLDDNKAGTLPKKDKVSCGVMAYKVSTVQRHAKGCYGDSLTNEEAVGLALDESKAKSLAKCAIFGTQNAIGEWSAATSEMKIKVSLIREME